MRKIIILSIFTGFISILSNPVIALNYTFSTPASSNLVVSGNTYETKDDKYTSYSNPNWVNDFKNLQIKNRVSVRWDRDNTPFVPLFAGDVFVELSITYEYLDGSNQLQSSGPNVIVLRLSNDTGRLALDKDISSKLFYGAVRTVVQVISIKDVNNNVLVPGTFPTLGQPLQIPVMLIENNIEIERIYSQSINTLVITTPSTQYLEDCVHVIPGNTNAAGWNEDILIQWPPMPLAEAYELEYLFIPFGVAATHYSTFNTVTPPNYTACSYSFRHNATRVRIAGKTEYTVPNIFEQGYILVRMRLIGRDFQNPGEEIFSDWTLPETGVYDVTQPPVITPPGYPVTLGNGVTSISAFLPDVNWVVQTTFAEEGKHKTQITYFDGTMRSRQSIVKNITKNYAIVGQNVFDFYGRESVSIPPAPTGDDYGYALRPRFNTSSISGNEFNWTDFDENSTKPGFENEIQVNPLSMSTGTAKYFSNGISGIASAISSNAPVSMSQYELDMHGYTPNAFGWIFNQVELMNDGTGRVSRSGNVGEVHSLSSMEGQGATATLNQRHEVKYGYEKPSQFELDMLFGNEVGYAKHYKKVLTTDPNGQNSVSYYDLSGRVIATALEGVGNVNDPLKPISSNGHNINATEYITNNDGISDDKASTAFKSFRLTSATVVQISYELIPEKYVPSECPYLCFDCKYKMRISLKDANDQEWFPNANWVSIGAPEPDEDISCQEGTYTFNLSPNPVVINLPPGQYTLYKELQLDMDVLNRYKELLLSNEQCLKDIEDFMTDMVSAVCEDCEIGCDNCDEALADVAAEIATVVDFCTQNNVDQSTHEPLLNLKNAENELKSRCNALCEPKTACQALYEMILLDVSPNGQYAKTVDFDVNGNPVVPVANSLLNDLNTMQGTVSTNNWTFNNVNVNWRNPVDYSDPNQNTCRNYKDASGKISYIMSINGLPEIKTGASYVTFSGDPNQYIKPQDLKYVDDFIKYWQESWSKSLAIFHPEFAYFQKCDAVKSTYEYDLLMNDEPEGSQARLKGYYNPIEIPINERGEINQTYINYTEGSTPVRDVALMSGGPLYGLTYSSAPTFKSVLNDFDLKYLDGGSCLTEQDVTIWELFERHKVGLGLTPISDDCASEVVWPILRGLYQMRKQQYLDKYYYSEVNNIINCGYPSGPLTIVQPRWSASLSNGIFNNSAFAAYIPSQYKFSGTSGTLASLLSTDIHTINLCNGAIDESDLAASEAGDMASICESNCEGVAQSWLDMLKDCPTLQNFYSTHTQQEKQDLIDDLASVCVGGCDADHPYGSINVNPALLNQYTYANIDAVFTAHLGTNWKTLGVCDPLLISFPYEYGHDYLASDDPARDECACDPNKYPNIEVEHCDPGTGNTLQGCACSKSSELGELLATYNGTIDDLKCKNCIICDDLELVTRGFFDIYGTDYTSNGPYLTDPYLYQKLLTTWFNREFGFNLTYQDYDEFARSCMAEFEPTSWINLWETVAINRKITYNPEKWDEFYARMSAPVQLRNKTTIDPYRTDQLADRTRDRIYLADNPRDLWSLPVNTGIEISYSMMASAEADRAACHCEKVLAIKKLIDDNKNNGIQGEQLFEQIYGSTWTSKFTSSFSFSDISNACCNLKNGNPINTPPPCTPVGFEYGTKFNTTERDHIDQELGQTPLDPILARLSTVDNPCTPDANNGDKGFLDICACKKLKQLKDAYTTYLSGNPTPILSYEAWVFQQEGVSGSDLADLEAHCEEMWKTGANKDNAGNITENYSSTTSWDDIAKINLNNYAFQKDWLVPKKFKCTTINVNDPPEDGGDFGNYIPPCMSTLNCEDIKAYLKNFIQANPNAYPDPISLSDLNDPELLEKITRDLLGNYKNITSGRTFVVNTQNQPYIDFWNSFGTYLDGILNNCTPHVSRNIQYYFHVLTSVYDCYIEFQSTKKDPPCETCWAANTEFISDFIDFLNHATTKTAPNYLYQTKWYLKHNPTGTTMDFPEFYANSGLYNGSSPATLRYYIQPGYNNSFIKVLITDNAGYNMNFEINLPGYKPYWNIGEITEFLNPVVPMVSNCVKGDLLSATAKVNILPKFWNNTDYPELASCPNSFNGQYCELEIPISIRLYSHDLYTQVPCLGCGKLCNKSIAQTDAIPEEECGEDDLEIGMDEGLRAYSDYIDKYMKDFTDKYLSKCMKAAESLQMGRELRMHHYMLYYYDQAGSLIKTVPPEGIDLDADYLTSVARQQIADNRHTQAVAHRALATNLRAIPEHWMVTSYRYNSLGANVWTSTPDGGESNIWYDELGRAACSRNSKQNAASVTRYGYTRYDNLGRPFEGGELNTYTLSTPEDVTELDDNFSCSEIRITTGNSVNSVISGDRNWTSYTPLVTEFLSEPEKLKVGYKNGVSTTQLNEFGVEYDLPYTGSQQLSFEVVSMSGSTTLDFDVYDFNSAGNWTLLASGVQVNNSGFKSLSFTNNYRRIKLKFKFIYSGGVTSNPEIILDNLLLTQNALDFRPYPQLFNAGAFIPRMLDATKQEVSLTLYDRKTEVTGLSGILGPQSNLIKRVSSSFFFESLPSGITNAETLLSNMNSSNPISGYTHATHYSYDIHGNVHTLVQDIPELGSHFNQQFFSLRYKYDLISGNTHEVQYQQPLDPDDAPPVDAFYHRYLYDDDNRLVIALTSRDHWHWEKDAQYYYYLHGCLMRTELGEQKVQGLDYAHTTEGWIKAVNSGDISLTDDMGKDGVTGNMHAKVGRDAFGYSLSYYNGDYIPTGTSYTNPEPNLEPVLTSTISQHLYNLYNGNIRAMQTCIPDIQQYASAARNIQSHTLGFAYRYDQLNRLRDFKTFDNLNYGTNEWGNSSQTGLHRYAGTYTFDAVGNIKSLMRIANPTYGAAIGTMDDLTYHYNYSGNKLQNNKLNYITEVASTPGFTADLENQSTGNYSYDGLGNLISDVAEEIEEIKWNSKGKIAQVNRLATSAKGDLSIVYGVGSRRICKVSRPHINNIPPPGNPEFEPSDERKWMKTWYITDASGQSIATYGQYISEINGNYNADFQLKELYMYGSEKLGYLEEDMLVSVKALGTPGYNEDGSFNQQTWTSMGEAELTTSEIQANIDAWTGQITFVGIIRGQKRFELANHLGNVLIVITDRKLAFDINADFTWEYFQPYIRVIQDYYPFGSDLPGRSLIIDNYRFGFNNQEMDREIGEYYAFEFRIHDARLGRFFSVDPVEGKYPWNSSYAFAENRVIDGIDLEGLEFFGKVDHFGTVSKKQIDPNSVQFLYMYNGSLVRGENIKELEVLGPEGASWTTEEGITYYAKPYSVLAFTDDLGIRATIGYYSDIHKYTPHLITDNIEPYGNARLYAEQFQINLETLGLSRNALQNKRWRQPYYDFVDAAEKTLFNVAFTFSTMGAGAAISGGRWALAGYNMLGNASGQFLGNLGNSQNIGQAVRDINVASVVASGIFQSATLSNYLLSTTFGSVNIKVGSFTSSGDFSKDIGDITATSTNLLTNSIGNAAGYGLGKIAPHKFDWQIKTNRYQEGYLGGLHNYASSTISTSLGVSIPIETKKAK